MSSLSSPKRRFGGRRALLAGGVALAVFAIPAVAYAAGTFTDVSSKNAYYKDVKAATTSGLMAGCSKTKFCPKTAATRQDVARLANRLGALTPGLKPIVNAKTALTAGAALTAATADNATHATNADNATNAVNAENAVHATSADSAATATTATSASSATSAADSAALGGVAASGYVKNAGEVLIGAPTSAWTNFSSANAATFTNFSDTTRALSATAFNSFLENGFATPTGIYGNQLSVLGLQLCYDATHGAAIDSVFLNVRSASAGIGTQNFVASDSTTRTDAACRTYTVTSPAGLLPGSSVTLFVQVAFGASTYVDLPSATLILGPSGSALTPLNRPLTKGPLTVMKPVHGRLPFASH